MEEFLSVSGKCFIMLDWLMINKMFLLLLIVGLIVEKFIRILKNNNGIRIMFLNKGKMLKSRK